MRPAILLVVGKGSSVSRSFVQRENHYRRGTDIPFRKVPSPHPRERSIFPRFGDSAGRPARIRVIHATTDGRSNLCLESFQAIQSYEDSSRVGYYSKPRVAEEVLKILASPGECLGSLESLECLRNVDEKMYIDVYEGRRREVEHVNAQ